MYRTMLQQTKRVSPSSFYILLRSSFSSLFPALCHSTLTLILRYSLIMWICYGRCAGWGTIWSNLGDVLREILNMKIQGKFMANNIQFIYEIKPVHMQTEGKYVIYFFIFFVMWANRWLKLKLNGSVIYWC